MDNLYIIPPTITPSQEVIEKVDSFLAKYKPLEIENNVPLLLYFDEKSKAYYFICHIDGKTLSDNCDYEATIDPDDEDEVYKLNRDITEDQAAFKFMEKDASDGRSFEDMVIEYDTSYHSKKPLKIYGGQHRLKAIENAKKERGNIYHGIRVYFGLSRDQKVEIARVNNTSIAVPNDLLDRMSEQLLGPQLRDWCQSTGLLESGDDFADRKSPDKPTARIVRTLLVNFHNGIHANDDAFHQPVLCKSGGTDDAYLKLRETINWFDRPMLQMGKQFIRLHKLQKETVSERDKDNFAEFARKTLSMAVVASWAYAAGFFQRNPEYLKTLYSLPDSVTPPEDPLNAKALSDARLKGTDPDTYRGLGARNSPDELGRMFEVFLVLATKASKKKITKDLANAAIQSYEAKKANIKAEKVLKKI
jgi:hypothetical protein